MLDQARQWLVRAKESTTPAQDVAQFKAFVATVAEAAKQKKLSEAIQLDALEMVRRSEDALGRAIREGQTAGEIASVRTNNSKQTALRSLVSPKEFLPDPHEARDAYAMADSSPEEFDEALAAAKEEGNLSRANVVRQLRGCNSNWGTTHRSRISIASEHEESSGGFGLRFGRDIDERV